MTAIKLILRIAAVTVLLVIAAGPAAGNAYAEDFAECEIPVTCRISEDIPVDMDLDFTYLLEADSEECPMPAGSNAGKKTVHMTDSGKVDFGKISFDKPEVFHYTLKEITNEKGRFRRDKTVYHTALVADTDGNVNIVVNNSDGKKPDKIEFVNSYSPKKTLLIRAPKTGDSADIRKYMLLLMVSMLAVIMFVWKRKQRGRHDRDAGWLDGAHDKCLPAGEMNMKSRILFKIMAVIGAILVAFAVPWENSYAADLVSTVHDYNRLPVNLVEISPLNFSQAQFTSLNTKIKKGPMEYLLSGSKTTQESIYWKSSTAPSFGPTNATEIASAKLGTNIVTGGLFTLRFSNAATLPDGSTKDVLMYFSNLTFGLSKNTNGTTGSNYYYPLVRIASDGSGRYCNSGIGINTANTGRLKGVRSATRIQTTIKIVEPGTDTLIPEKHYILGFRDLDVKDNTTATGENVDRYNGVFAEGIGLYSGFDEPVYLSATTSTVQVISDGSPKFRGTKPMDGGIDSGFDISVSSSGFSYFWYGSHNMPVNGSDQGADMSTQFGYSPKVKVLASKEGGGTIQKEGVKEYLVNTTTSYTYTPSQGYRVKSLKVDGSSVDFTENGGTYEFEKLTATDNAQYDHTIKVVFQKPQDVVIKNNVKGTLGDRNKEFQFSVILTRLEPNALYEISQTSTGKFTGMDGYGTKVSDKSFRSNSDGRAYLKVTLKDDQFIKLLQLTGNSQYTIEEKLSDHEPSFEVTADGTDPVIVKTQREGYWQNRLPTAAETVDDGDGVVTVQFNNTKEMAAPTGVKNSRVPLIAAAVILLMLIAVKVVISSKRARSEKR